MIKQLLNSVFDAQYSYLSVKLADQLQSIAPNKSQYFGVSGGE
jgi:hypothetical protein